MWRKGNPPTRLVQPLGKTVRRFLKKLKIESYHMIQHSHFWVCIWGKLYLGKIHVPQCSHRTPQGASRSCASQRRPRDTLRWICRCLGCPREEKADKETLGAAEPRGPRGPPTPTLVSHVEKAWETSPEGEGLQGINVLPWKHI